MYTIGFEMTMHLEQSPEARVLLPAGAIAARVSELGRRIASDYSGSELLAAIVLRGAFVFAGDLIRAVGPALDLRLDFIVASSYGDARSSSGRVDILKALDRPVTGRHVLIVEDIIETGRTLHAIVERLAAERPASLRVATLLHKPGKLEKPVALDYVGFEIPDVFVVGYGLDLAEQHRHLPEIRVIEERRPGR